MLIQKIPSLVWTLLWPGEGPHCAFPNHFLIFLYSNHHGESTCGEQHSTNNKNTCHWNLHLSCCFLDFSVSDLFPYDQCMQLKSNFIALHGRKKLAQEVAVDHLEQVQLYWSVDHVPLVAIRFWLNSAWAAWSNPWKSRNWHQCVFPPRPWRFWNHKEVELPPGFAVLDTVQNYSEEKVTPIHAVARAMRSFFIADNCPHWISDILPRK